MTTGSKPLLYDDITVVGARMKKKSRPITAGLALRLTHWTVCTLTKPKANHNSRDICSSIVDQQFHESS